MKKNTKILIIISAFILVAAVIITVFFCTKNKKAVENTTTKHNTVNEATVVTFKSDDDTCFKLAIDKKTITNLNEKIGLALSYVPKKGDEFYTFGADFSLQKMTDAGWRPVKLTYDNFEEIAYELSPSSRVQAQVIVLSEHFDMLKNGKYRIVKVIKDKDNNNVEAYAEIEIKLPADASKTTTK